MFTNRNGQMLVLFVIFLPIFIILAGLVLDIGIATNQKNRLNNINYSACSYALDNYNEMMILEQILSNDSMLLVNDISISKEEDKIIISIEKNIDSIFTGVVGIFNYRILSVYEAQYINGKKIIRKVESTKV